MALLAIGGFPGAGKTTICRRLSSELNLPCLSSDTIGRTIEASQGIGEGRIDAYRVVYDVLFQLCDEFIRPEVQYVDASGDEDHVYAQVKQYVVNFLKQRTLTGD